MSNKFPFIILAYIYALPLFSQVPLTTATNTLRHGDILCKIEVPYVDQGDRGSESVWNLPEIPKDGKEYLQAINSNIDTVAIYEEGRILHYLAHGDTVCFKGQQSPRAYKIYSQERPYIKYPFQYGDSISGNYKGDCRDENDYFTVQGFGYTVADGVGCLTAGDDTLKHVTRIHLLDDFDYKFTDGAIYHFVEDRYIWYCAGYRYSIMESVKTYVYENGNLKPINKISYLFLPYMQLELPEDAANDALFAELERADAARNARNEGFVTGNLSSIDAALSSDCKSVIINYTLNSNSDISFFAFDIMGNLLSSVLYQNKDAGEWQECLYLNRNPIGNTLMLRINFGEQSVSIKVSN